MNTVTIYTNHTEKIEKATRNLVSLENKLSNLELGKISILELMGTDQITLLSREYSRLKSVEVKSICKGFS